MLTKATGGWEEGEGRPSICHLFCCFLQTRYFVAVSVLQNEQSSALLIPPKCVSSLAPAALPDFAAGLSLLSCAVSGRLGLTSAGKADHLLGFSVCSWEGGRQSKLQSRLRFQLLLGQGRPLSAGERLPGAGLRGARTAGGHGAQTSQRGWRGRLHPRHRGCSWLRGRTKARVLSLGLQAASFTFQPQFPLSVKWKQM